MDKQQALNEILLGSAARGDVASVKDVLKDGADPKATIKTSRGKKSAIDLAREGRHAEVVRVLIEAGADDCDAGPITPPGRGVRLGEFEGYVEAVLGYPLRDAPDWMTVERAMDEVWQKLDSM